ncbi:MAG TPA: phosphotransferase [Xanthomonadaceae bacterium]|nr:phosphotransferase [Xanthomonadaceae bacterium]
MIGRERILALVPHQGAMCLLDAVEQWDEGSIVCSTGSHRRAENPLRREGRLAALHLCEYGAQAMAVHGGLLAAAAGAVAAPGLLVSLREVRLEVDRIDTLAGPLQVRATRLLGDESGWQYAFSVAHEGRIIAQGRAAVMLRKATQEGA